MSMCNHTPSTTTCKNKWEWSDDHSCIKLFLNGNHADESFTLIDEDDLDLISPYSWSASPTGGVHRRNLYAKAYVGCQAHGGNPAYLHRFILNLKPMGRGAIVDHINRNTLDNRKLNLRVAGSTINAANRPGEMNSSSQYKGVSWGRHIRKWTARARGTHLGVFDNEIDAAIAYDNAAYDIWGGDAYLNFPELSRRRIKHGTRS